MDTAYDKDGIYLGKLADVFGDPTRRNIYRFLRECDVPQSASEVAASFGLHRTVARAHLEKLCELGLVETATRRRPSGGRPAKIYSITETRLEVMLPPRRYERLARNLLRVVGASLPAAEVATAVSSIGRDYGEEVAAGIVGDDAQAPVKLSPHTVIEWMDLAGYGATSSADPGGATVIEIHNCVYRELAAEYPDVVCSFDQAMLCGMLGADPKDHTQTHSLSSGDAFCRHEFRL